MNAKLPITVVIAVKNEALNLPSCLEALTRAERVLLVDSHSSDGTIEIAHAAGVEIVQFEYSGGYPKKRQWALDTQSISTSWTLLLDADEVVTEDLWNEIETRCLSNLAPRAYSIRKNFFFMGRKMRFGGFSHSAVMLFRTGTARFEKIQGDGHMLQDMEIHERLFVKDPLEQLSSGVNHCDDKGLFSYYDRHNRYSSWEAGVRYGYIETGSYGEDAIKPDLFGGMQGRRRLLKSLATKVPFEPWLWFAYHYVFRLGFLEGRRGLIASQARAEYIRQVRAKLFELRIRTE